MLYNRYIIKNNRIYNTENNRYLKTTKNGLVRLYKSKNCPATKIGYAKAYELIEQATHDTETATEPENCDPVEMLNIFDSRTKDEDKYQPFLGQEIESHNHASWRYGQNSHFEPVTLNPREPYELQFGEEYAEELDHECIIEESSDCGFYCAICGRDYTAACGGRMRDHTSRRGATGARQQSDNQDNSYFHHSGHDQYQSIRDLAQEINGKRRRTSKSNTLSEGAFLNFIQCFGATARTHDLKSEMYEYGLNYDAKSKRYNPVMSLLTMAYQTPLIIAPSTFERVASISGTLRKLTKRREEILAEYSEETYPDIEDQIELETINWADTLPTLYVLFKYLEAIGFSSLHLIPNFYAQRTLNRYDVIWSKLIEGSDLEFIESKEQIVDLNEVRSLWGQPLECVAIKDPKKKRTEEVKERVIRRMHTRPREKATSARWVGPCDIISYKFLGHSHWRIKCKKSVLKQAESAIMSNLEKTFGFFRVLDTWTDGKKYARLKFTAPLYSKTETVEHKWANEHLYT